jgi:hypothetical protein
MLVVLYVLKQEGIETFLNHFTEGGMEAEVAERVQVWHRGVNALVLNLKSLETLAKSV